MNKFINPLTVALYAFIVGYGMTAIFSRIPVSDNFIVNSIFIFIVTILIVIGTVFLIKKIFDRQQTDHK